MASPFPEDDRELETELLRLQRLTAQRADQICRQKPCVKHEEDLAIWLQAEQEIFGINPAGSG